MHPNPPQPEFPQPGQPPMAGGPGPTPAAPKARANAAAAIIAGVLAVLTVAMLVWFAFYNIVFLYEITGGWSGVVVVNVLGGALGAGLLLIAAGFTFARRIGGAWTLCGLCVFYVMAFFVVAPLLWGTPLSEQVRFLLGFEESNGVAIGLAIIFGVLTALTAAVAGSVKSNGSVTVE